MAADIDWNGHRTRLKSAFHRAAAAARADFTEFTWSWMGFFRWTGISLLALIVSTLIVLYFLDWNAFRGPIARYASLRLGREVRIDGNLDVRLFTLQPRISVGRLKIGNPAWLSAPLAADIKQLTVEVRLLPLLSGTLVVPYVHIVEPQILLVRDAAGRTNWDISRSNSATGWNLPAIQRFILDDGHLQIDDRLRKLLFLGTISSQERSDAAHANAFELTGQGTLNGRTFLADIHGGPLIHVEATRPYAFTADIRAGATHAVGSGAITRPFHFGEYTLAATFSGPNLADLYYLTGLALPGTPPYRVSGTLTRSGPLYRFSRFSGIAGGSDVRGDVSADVSGAHPFVRGTVTSRTLDFTDLGALFGSPAVAHRVNPTLPAARAPAPGATAFLLPDVPLHVEHMRQMNAEVDYKADTVKSRDFPLRELATHVSLENGVLVLKPLAFSFSRGKLAGWVQIDARNAVSVTDLDARMTGIRIEQFIPGSEKPVEGALDARVKLEGSGNSVHRVAASANGALTLVVPQGKIRRTLAEWLGVNVLSGIGLTLTGDASQANVRCAVAHFSAQKGVFTAQDLVFDTDPVLVEGHGDIDLANENVNLTLQGKPKDFQLVRLRVPVTVQGSLSHPAIDVHTNTAIMQGGIALALGFLMPAAAILPFVDPGLAKDADCTSLLAQTAHQSAPVKVAPRPMSRS